MIMKDIEALMEQAKNGDQSELYYLYDNRLGVFAPDFNDDDKLSDFLKECSDININLAKLSDILEEDIKLELSKIREQNDYNIGLHNAFAHIKFKLQELKGSDKE